jgi:hypothetical protein
MGKPEHSRTAIAAASRRPQIELLDAASWQGINDGRLEMKEAAKRAALRHFAGGGSMSGASGIAADTGRVDPSVSGTRSMRSRTSSTTALECAPACQSFSTTIAEPGVVRYFRP